MLTVRPGTTAQLATAFLISMCFLMLHIGIRPFRNDQDNDYQLYSMVSVLLVLFSGDYNEMIELGH